MRAGLDSGGKYDDVATEVRVKLDADGVCLIVIGGPKGAGFSVQGKLQFVVALPEILEEAARAMRHKMQTGDFSD